MGDLVEGAKWAATARGWDPTSQVLQTLPLGGGSVRTVRVQSARIAKVHPARTVRVDPARTARVSLERIGNVALEKIARVVLERTDKVGGKDQTEEDSGRRET